jgi:two-component system response regulator AlgR
MRIAIVDDEPLARARLRAQVQEIGLGEIVAEAANGLEAIRAVESTQPDVVLLDIRMPGMDGIETARHLMNFTAPPAVVFTTAYDEHALAASEANAIDYLLKPIRSGRLQQALEKARVLTAAQTGGVVAVSDSSARTHVSGVVQGNMSLVAIEQVLYFHADQGYVDVIWDGGSILIEESLRALEKEFGDRFVRVHRNALVAVEYITGLQRDAGGNYLVSVHAGDTQLPVSRRLLSQVRKRLR